jgi:HEAT repeat protein
MPAFVTSSDLVLKIALLTGLTAMAMAVVVFLGVLVLRGRSLRTQWRRDAFNARWRPILTRFALTGTDPGAGAAPLPQLARHEHAFLLEEWNILHDLLSGEARPRLNDLARRLGMDEFAWRLLGRRRLGDRLLAVATLGHLQEYAAWDAILPLLRDHNTLISLVSARALIGIDPVAAVPLVLPVIRAREDWSTPRVADLFVKAGPAAVAAPLEEAILESAPEDIPKLIAVLPEISLPTAARLVSELLRRPTDDRIKAICLRILDNPRELPIVRELTSHPRWHLRMAAAVVLGRLGLPQDREHLVRLLSDPEWWVRYRAAQALLAMPFVPRADMIALQATAEDRFARDILAHALAEIAA